MSDNLTTARKIMDQVIVLEATYHMVENRVEYTAMSPHFKVLERGELVPSYRCVIEFNGDVGFR